jgi:hypothetical protein
MAMDLGSSALYQSALQRSQERYRQMLEELKKVEGIAQEPLAPEFEEAVSLFRTGGEYGAGARTAIERAAKTGTSQSLAELARTGMSSGTIAQGIRARYGRQATEQIQQVEDVRYEKLSSALQALASAKEARGIRNANIYQTTAGAISSFREPTMGDVTNQEAIALANIRGANLRAMLDIKAQKKLQESQQKFTAGQTELYTPTVADQFKLAELKTPTPKYNYFNLA